VRLPSVCCVVGTITAPLLRPRLTALKDPVPLRVTAVWPDAGARLEGTPFPATGAEDTDK